MITAIKKQHVDAIHQLCNISFGSDYISTSYIAEHLSSKKKLGFVLLENETLTGFVLLSLIDSTAIQNEVLSEKEWFINEYKPYEKISFIQQVVVHPNYQKEGRVVSTIVCLRNHLDN